MGGIGFGRHACTKVQNKSFVNDDVEFHCVGFIRLERDFGTQKLRMVRAEARKSSITVPLPRDFL